MDRNNTLFDFLGNTVRIYHLDITGFKKQSHIQWRRSITHVRSSTGIPRL